jgi:hypothetical protein
MLSLVAILISKLFEKVVFQAKNLRKSREKKSCQKINFDE